MPRFLNFRVTFSLLLPTLCAACVVGEPTEFSETNSVDLDVVVTDQSGAPVRGLKQQDFTVFDNGVPRDIASFEPIDGRLAAMEVVIVLDAVNTGEREVAIEREEINKFLRVDGGHLAHPTRVALLTDKGLQFQEDFSQDGIAISSALKHTKIPLRSIGRDADHRGEADRFQISFQAFAQLIADERNRPGRKLIIWVSPGWPLLSREVHNTSLREQIFGNLIEISKQVQQGEITLDSIDPTSMGDIDPGLTDPPTVHLRPSNENATLEGARNPNDRQWRNLALDVIAVQSGGLALHPGNDIASELQKSVADRSAYYEISFNRVVTDRANEYHSVDVRIGKPTLTARTRQGYYSQRLRARTSPVELQHPANAPNDPRNVSSHSYIDQSLTDLVKRIPELKTVRPAADQQKLYVILQKVGLRVDDFMRNIGDLIASEDIMQEKLNENGRVTAKERVQR